MGVKKEEKKEEERQHPWYPEWEEEEEEVKTEGALMCRRCGCWFVFGVGSYSEPRGGTVLGHCAEGGLCWQCVDVLKQRRKTKYKKGWTQGMLDRLQQEEDMLNDGYDTNDISMVKMMIDLPPGCPHPGRQSPDDSNTVFTTRGELGGRASI